MAKCDAITSMMAAVKRRPDTAHIMAEAIKKMFEFGMPELVVQAVNGKLVQFLLTLLESPLSECEKPSATKAVIAEALKVMAKDLANGEKVCVHVIASTCVGVYIPYVRVHEVLFTFPPSLSPSLPPSFLHPSIHPSIHPSFPLCLPSPIRSMNS